MVLLLLGLWLLLFFCEVMRLLLHFIVIVKIHILLLLLLLRLLLLQWLLNLNIRVALGVEHDNSLLLLSILLRMLLPLKRWLLLLLHDHLLILSRCRSFHIVFLG